MTEIACPECTRPLQVDLHSRSGHIVTCPHCETQSVLVGQSSHNFDLEPVELDDTKKKNRLKITCLECNSPIKLRAQIRRGQRITCKRCQTILEVVKLDPVELDLAFPSPPKRTRRDKSANRKRTRKQRDRDWGELA